MDTHTHAHTFAYNIYTHVTYMCVFITRVCLPHVCVYQLGLDRDSSILLLKKYNFDLVDAMLHA
jgi:hypothetical protein